MNSLVSLARPYVVRVTVGMFPSLLGPAHCLASCTYRQVLWGESAQTRQVPPGGSVELLHLLGELLLETPLLFVLLRVSELHHDR